MVRTSKSFANHDNFVMHNGIEYIKGNMSYDQIKPPVSMSEGLKSRNT